MSIDLSLLPFDADQPTIAFSHTILLCECSYSLYDKIQCLPAFPLPEGFTCYCSREPVEGCPGYEEPHYGEAHDDAYGNPLQYVVAAALAQLRTVAEVRASAKNRAVWAYLAALPPTTKVALYWH